jgi:hypothetical protein
MFPTSAVVAVEAVVGVIMMILPSAEFATPARKDAKEEGGFNRAASATEATAAT